MQQQDTELLHSNQTHEYPHAHHHNPVSIASDQFSKLQPLLAEKPSTVTAIYPIHIWNRWIPLKSKAVKNLPNPLLLKFSYLHILFWSLQNRKSRKQKTT